MGYEAPINILSPESRLLEFKVPPNAGFWTFPHSDIALDGWGEPFVDEEGNPVPEPGTLGGPNPIKFLAWNIDESAWESNREPGNQLYGNIDWLGPYKNPTNPKEGERERLSYWGPPGRHFPSPSFVYGSEQKHEDIYRNGKYLSIAPYPVLGAAILVDELPPVEPIPDPPPPPVLGDWLVVVCKVGLDCKVYSRLIPSSSYQLEAAQEVLDQVDEMYNVPKGEMTDPLRERIKERYDSSLNPYGWIYMGTVFQVQGDGKIGQAPNTPWFFNESGDVAQCVQDVEITHDNGRVTGFKEMGKEIRAITLANYRTFTQPTINNVAGFTYSARCTKGSKPHITINTDNNVNSSYSFPACIGEYWQSGGSLEAGRFDYVHRDPATPSVDHYMAVDHVRNETDVTGNYIVGVDYYEDDEIYIYLRYDCTMSAEKWWRYCIDRVVRSDYESSGDFVDYAGDGMFFNWWAWWDANGNLVETVKNAADDGSYATIQDYIEAGEPIPPSGPDDGRIGAYFGLYGRVWLEWTHPVYGLQTMNLYRAIEYEQYLDEEGDREYVPNEDPLWIQYFNYLHFFDIRPKDGFLSAYFQEKYTKKLTDVGVLGIEVTETQYTLEYAKHPDNENDKPYTIVDRRIDPDVVVVNDDRDVPGQLCDMLAWNPEGAEASPHEATTTIFARNNFVWDYTVTQYEAEYVPQEDFDTANLEPSPQYWHDNNGWNFFPWPKWRDLVSDQQPQCLRDGSVTFNASHYLFSFKYTDAQDEVAYFNYITDGDLETIVQGATRFYPALGT